MKNAIHFLIVFSVLLILIDLYTFKGIRMLTKSWESEVTLQVIKWIYWVMSATVLMLLWYSFLKMESTFEAKSYKMPFTVAGIFIIYVVSKITFIAFLLVEDIGFLTYWGVSKITGTDKTTEMLTRGEFLWQSISKVGIGLAGLQLGALVYGVAKGRFNFQVINQTVEFDNLPSNFDGLKIVQLSDMHIGSFFDNHDEIKKAFEKVNSLKPDYILFTGDMVNNYAWELDGWEEIIGTLKAKEGKYSILGNHDYADYVKWESETEKQKNIEDLKTRQAKMGFKLLLNESVKLEREGEFIELLGIENWGKGGFSKYGDLAKTMANTVKDSFKILLSHDPSHWDEQVLGKTNIDLALAGHTHGMQYGIKIGSFEISPASLRYPRWGGLYTEEKQHLYVNRGFGYLGFPGRVGILPEITLLEIRKKV